MINVGDKIRIINMKDEPQYNGKIGIVIAIDDLGQIHGTWGGCAIIPSIDEFEIIKKLWKCIKLLELKYRC